MLDCGRSRRRAAGHLSRHAQARCFLKIGPFWTLCATGHAGRRREAEERLVAARHAASGRHVRGGARTPVTAPHAWANIRNRKSRSSLTTAASDLTSSAAARPVRCRRTMSPLDVTLQQALRIARPAQVRAAEAEPPEGAAEGSRCIARHQRSRSSCSTAAMVPTSPTARRTLPCPRTCHLIKSPLRTQFACLPNAPRWAVEERRRPVAKRRQRRPGETQEGVIEICR